MVANASIWRTVSAASVLLPTSENIVRVMPMSAKRSTPVSMRAPALTHMAPIGVAARKDGRDSTVKSVGRD
jgi:hypothetical protein